MATQNGKRRLTPEKIKAYSKDPDWLGQCDRNSLRGLASRPLLRYYSNDAQKFNQKPLKK
jgi:hypothetical protein